MRSLCLAVALVAAGVLALPSASEAQDGKKKRLLFVTHSGGFIHDSVGVAEDVLKEIGPDNGFEVTCFRYTGDPAGREKYAEEFRKRTGKTVEAENSGRVNAETLKKFDAVLFFTTGNPLNNDEVKDLVEWVNAGGAIAGTHCGADTLYPSKDQPWNEAYGRLIGAYFKTHPPGFQKIKIKVEDANHPAGKTFKDGEPYEDEMYIFRDEPYSRERLHIILSVTADSVDSLLSKAPKAARTDNDYAISWCQEHGKGKSFYTSLGHRKEVWKDPKFQGHLIGGLKWATNQAPGDAKPSGKRKGD